MASRENQGLQIALIIFVILTVGLSVATYYFWSDGENAKERMRVAEKRATDENAAVRLASDKIEALKFMVGYGEFDLTSFASADPEMQQIIDGYNEDMKVYGEGLNAKNLNYRSLPTNMERGMRERNQQLQESITRETDLKDEKQAVAKAETDRANVAVSEHTKLVALYGNERKEFVDYRSQMNDRNQQLVKNHAAEIKKYQDSEGALKVERTTLQKDITRLNGLLAGARERLEQLAPDNFDGPDGYITFVNQRNRIVWINLGLADGLRRQTTFAVYDRDASGVMNVENKGSIEITKVIGQHLAEGRILDDKDGILLPGDQIHSPAFRPGRRVSFAIAGFIDIDGDGTSDREMLRNLITMSGGEIAAEVHDDGQQTGKLAPTTSFLILGAAPTEKTGGGARSGFTAIFRQAKDLSIRDISVDDFLAYIGWKGEAKTIRLGRGADADDFKARSPDGVVPKSTGATSEIFRNRKN